MSSESWTIEYPFQHQKQNRSFVAPMSLALAAVDLLKPLDNFERRLRIVYPRSYRTIARGARLMVVAVDFFGSHFPID